MKKYIVLQLALCTATVLSGAKFDYSEWYKSASNKAHRMGNRITAVKNILKHAPDEFFLKRKGLQKYRFKIKNLIVNMGKAIVKNPQPGLKRQYLQLVAQAYNHKHIGAIHPKTMRQCIYRMFKKEINAFKKANSSLKVISMSMEAGKLPKKARKKQADLAKFKKKEQAAYTAKPANSITRMKAKFWKKKRQGAEKWLRAYETYERGVPQKQRELNNQKREIRQKATNSARAIDPVIAKVLNDKFKEFTDKKTLTMREKSRLRKIMSKPRFL